MRWGWDTGCYLRPNAQADRETLHVTIASQGAPTEALKGCLTSSARGSPLQSMLKPVRQKWGCQHHTEAERHMGSTTAIGQGPKTDGDGNAELMMAHAVYVAEFRPSRQIASEVKSP
jgi:hypothetical protein